MNDMLSRYLVLRRLLKGLQPLLASEMADFENALLITGLAVLLLGGVLYLFWFI